MQSTEHTNRPRQGKRKIPLLARHAITLAAAFMIALPLSLIVGNKIYRDRQLDKLVHEDPLVYQRGLSYAYENVLRDEVVMERSLEAIATISPQRAADLLLGLIEAHQKAGKPIPEPVFEGIGTVTSRLPVRQALDLYSIIITIQPIAEDERLPGLFLRSLKHDEDDSVFLSTVGTLDTYLLWRQELVPQDVWVRWLSVNAASDDPPSQRMAVRLLGELHELVDDPRMLDSLERLAGSEDASVRSRLLQVVAGFAAQAQAPSGYEQLLFTLGADADAGVARRAWQAIAHLDPASGYAVSWRDAEPSVAAAMLWAAAKTNSDSAPLIRQAWDAGLRLSATHALYELPIDAADAEDPAWARLRMVLTRAPESEEEVRLYWRCLPALHRGWGWYGQGIRAAVMPSLFQHFDPQAIRSSENSGVIEAAVYYARVGFEPAEWAEADSGLYLAWLEGLELGPDELALHPMPIYHEQPGILLFRQQDEGHPAPAGAAVDDRWFPYTYEPAESPPILASSGDPVSGVTALRELPREPVTADMWVSFLYGDYGSAPPEDVVGEVERNLRSYDPHLRITAALYAGMAGIRPQLVADVTAELLRENPGLDVNTIHLLSDERLSELGLRRVDAVATLSERIGNGDNSPESRVESRMLRLALWMRGDLGDDFTPEAEAMLYDATLPTSTVLMCLLHMQRPIALDYLLGNALAEGTDLQDLLIYRRWWHVFRRHVDTSDMPLWLWADPEAQAFQLEAIRQWYAVNRWRLQDGDWWPEPTDG